MADGSMYSLEEQLPVVSCPRACMLVVDGSPPLWHLGNGASREWVEGVDQVATLLDVADLRPCPLE